MEQIIEKKFDTFSPRAGSTIAYHKTPGNMPGVLFCGGFMSDMTGTKATYFESACAARGQSYVRFDYAGHGASPGVFTEHNIGSWFQNALDVLDHLTSGPQIIVGSSMGGWIGLLLARARKDRVSAYVGLAAAPDFTEDIFNTEFNDTQRREVMESGITHIPSAYGDPYPLTRQLFEDGKNHLLLHTDIDITCPVRLVHGKMDADVPWEKSVTIAEKTLSTDVRTVFIDDGDHRLARDQDLKTIDAIIVELSQ
jgi:pimeloyl-ACP methyl ester carboxylesterase